MSRQECRAINQAVQNVMFHEIKLALLLLGLWKVPKGVVILLFENHSSAPPDVLMLCQSPRFRYDVIQDQGY